MTVLMPYWAWSWLEPRMKFASGPDRGSDVHGAASPQHTTTTRASSAGGGLDKTRNASVPGPSLSHKVTPVLLRAVTGELLKHRAQWKRPDVSDHLL